jgi:hypothetical protein
MPTLVWLYLTALLYYQTSATCVALAEALETTHIHSVAGLTGDGTAVVTTRRAAPPTTPSRTPGRSAGATGGGRARCHARTTGCSSWMHGRRAAATPWPSCGNRSGNAL